MDLVFKFKQLIDVERLSHAYLFWGSNSDYQLKFSLGLANYLENKIWDESRKDFRETIFVGGEKPQKSSIGIDDARKIKNFLSQSPIFSSKRCALVQGAELMTPEAQNAILKITEEPNLKTVLIFTSNSVENILPALSSRMVRVFMGSRFDKRGPRTEGFTTLKDLKNKDGVFIKELVDSPINLENFLNNLVMELRKDLLKNFRLIKEVLHRQRIMKQFNTNKKLQVEAIIEKL